jgi:Flagellar motor switch protein
MAFETFSRHWATQMVGCLRTAVQVSFEGLEMRSYDDYISSLGQITTMLVCKVEGGRRTAIVQFPLPSTLQWIERMLGGKGNPESVPDRDLTDIELRLVQYLMGRTLDDLNYSFSTVLPLDPVLQTVQYSPPTVQALPASTPVIVANFTIEVDGDPVAATVMIPSEEVVVALRERQADASSAEETEEVRAEREQLDRSVQEVPVEVGVRFRPILVHPREIIALGVGDIVRLRQDQHQPLEVVVGDLILAHASAATSGSRLAGLIVDVKEMP